jgi:hypothetical protein
LSGALKLASGAPSVQLIQNHALSAQSRKRGVKIEALLEQADTRSHWLRDLGGTK